MYFTTSNLCHLLFAQSLFVLRLTISANLVHASLFVAIKGTGRQGFPTRSLANSFCPAVVAHIGVVLLGYTVRHLCTPLPTFRTSRELTFKANFMHISTLFTTKRRRWQTSQAFCALPLGCLALLACSAPVHLVCNLWVWCPYLSAPLPT